MSVNVYAFLVIATPATEVGVIVTTWLPSRDRVVVYAMVNL
jgi:hypothetical protein